MYIDEAYKRTQTTNTDISWCLQCAMTLNWRPTQPEGREPVALLITTSGKQLNSFYSKMFILTHVSTTI